MQSRATQVGPLAAPSAINIALAQSPSAAGYLALNGSTTTHVANNICLSQNGTASTPLLLNGVLCRAQFTGPTFAPGATVAYIPDILADVNASSTTNLWSPSTGQPIYITSAGNDSAITFKVVGISTDGFGQVITETMAGTNASVVGSQYRYRIVLSITPSGNTASTVTAGTTGFALLDTARRVLFTSSGTDTGLTITLSGRDWSGQSISETLTGGSNGTPVYSVLDYLGVTGVQLSGATAGTMSVGTNGVASSPWINMDTWAMGTCAIQCVVSGTANFTVETTNDDPNSYGNPISRVNVTWDAANGGLIGQTASASYAFPVVPAWLRVLLNSQTNPGFVRMTAVQHSSVPI
jgi:hypothetical protein